MGRTCGEPSRLTKSRNTPQKYPIALFSGLLQGLRPRVLLGLELLRALLTLGPDVLPAAACRVAGRVAAVLGVRRVVRALEQLLQLERRREVSRVRANAANACARIRAVIRVKSCTRATLHGWC